MWHTLGKEKCIKVLVGKSEKRDGWEELGLDGKTVLKWILQK
jgi:hypothetical protein